MQKFIEFHLPPQPYPSCYYTNSLNSRGPIFIRAPLVRVLWVLQHPQFLKVWVLAPTVFGNFSTFLSIFMKINTNYCKSSNAFANSNIKHPQSEIPNGALVHARKLKLSCREILGDKDQSQWRIMINLISEGYRSLLKNNQKLSVVQKEN